jgi:hypothetical protein
MPVLQVTGARMNIGQLKNADEKKRGPAALFQYVMTKKIPTSVAPKPRWS